MKHINYRLNILSVIAFYKKYVFSFHKDALSWSKVAVNTLKYCKMFIFQGNFPLSKRYEMSHPLLKMPHSYCTSTPPPLFIKYTNIYSRWNLLYIEIKQRVVILSFAFCFCALSVVDGKTKTISLLLRFFISFFAMLIIALKEHKAQST